MSSSDTSTIELEDRGITITKEINPNAIGGALRVDFTITSAIEDPVELTFVEILPETHKDANIGYDNKYDSYWEHDSDNKQYLTFDITLDPAQSLETFYAVPTFDSDTDDITAFESPPEIISIEHDPQPDTPTDDSDTPGESDDGKQVTLEDTPNPPAEQASNDPDTPDSETDDSDETSPFDAPRNTDDTEPENTEPPETPEDTEPSDDTTPPSIPEEPSEPDTTDREHSPSATDPDTEPQLGTESTRALETRVEALEQQYQELQAYTAALEDLLNETGTVTDIKNSINTLDKRVTALENTTTQSGGSSDSDELEELREEVEQLKDWRDAMTSAVNPN